uniref:Uncharacterized protein n=1 Tax=Arcella intermedia TaxID=1963864 RepID=A0A6B2LSN2_9EUKA
MSNSLILPLSFSFSEVEIDLVSMRAVTLLHSVPLFIVFSISSTLASCSSLFLSLFCSILDKRST